MITGQGLYNYTVTLALVGELHMNYSDNYTDLLCKQIWTNGAAKVCCHRENAIIKSRLKNKLFYFEVNFQYMYNYNNSLLFLSKQKQKKFNGEIMIMCYVRS